MRRSSLSLVVAFTATIAVVWLLPGTVAASGDSTADTLIGALTERLLVLGIAVAVIVEAALLYAIIRYRNSGDAQPSRDNPRFLTAWVVAIGLILFFVGFASLQTMAALDDGAANPPDDAVQVDVTAQQWVWTFEYADEGVTSQGTLVVPENETIHLRVTSRDVIHSMHAPDLGLKQDASPGQWNNATFTPTKTGEYDLFCAEYCGQGHSRMRADIRVVNSSEYNRWLDDQRTRQGNQTG